MIFRRIKAHIEKENWFAVFIDFLIVVLGVYMGLQVQQWAVERDRQANEHAYLLRLHGELGQLIELRKHYDETRPLISSEVMAAIDVLKSDDLTAELTDFQCRTIIWSSSYYLTTPPYELPTLAELLAAGELNTISSPLLRTKILNYTQQASFARDFINANRGTSSHIVTQFPDLFVLGLDKKADNGVDDFGLEASCNFESMRTNHAFLNAVTLSAKQYISYTRRGILPVSQILKDLHVELDKILKVKHKQAESMPGEQ